MGKINSSPRYVTDITRPNPPSLGELEGGGVIWKNQKNEVFVTCERVIRS